MTEAKAAAEALARERSVLAERVAERTAELSRANEELAQAARLKDGFLASMSHELRTPLTAILGLSDLLLAGGRGPLAEPQARAVGMIQESGRHLLALITDILDVSKIGAGRLDLSLGWVDLRRVCEAALSLVTPSAVQKRHVLSLEAPATRTLFRADERRLKQVLVNLLGNAVKFTPPGGSIERGGPGGRGARRGADRGPRQRARASLPRPAPGSSARSSSSTPASPASTREAGSGSSSSTGSWRSTAAASSSRASRGTGAASPSSSPGSAATRTPPLPVAGGPDPSAPARPPAEGRPPAGTRILLVEDNDTQRSLFEEALGARGFEVEVARNGAEALEKAEAFDPDLVVMDVQMPGMDGLEATRRLRATPSLRATPVLALTALVMPGDRERCREAGVDEYLAKPVSLETLVEAVGRLARRRPG